MRTTLAERLFRARERAGKTPTQIAAAVGVTEDTIRRWESGSGEPRITQAPALVEALGCSGLWLVFEEGRP